MTKEELQKENDKLRAILVRLAITKPELITLNQIKNLDKEEEIKIEKSNNNPYFLLYLDSLTVIKDLQTRIDSVVDEHNYFLSGWDDIFYSFYRRLTQLREKLIDDAVAQDKKGVISLKY